MCNSRAVLVLLFVLFFSCFSNVFANNLTVSNVRLGSRDPSAKTVVVLFDVSWDNSWRNKINHDAAWFTVRLSDIQTSSSENRLCGLGAAGVSPSGTLAG